MDSPLWDRVQQIYYLTLPMTQAERSAFVSGECQQDAVLLREMNSLLEAHDSSEGFLETPIFELGLRLIARQLSTNIAGRSSLDSLVGSTIDDRYLVECELTKGGIGKIYLARDLTLHNRPVVIKVLLHASLQNSYLVKKFTQEVEALSRIDHHGVVSVLGAGKLPDEKPYLVMQYVEGVTLRSQIDREGMNLERAASIIKQIGAALEAIHERRIFHRDLKPENIILQRKTGAEFVKVVDFGIAKVKDSVVAPSTGQDLSIGTARYMSPEQLRGGEKITPASDIYSMAAIAYEMVTGRRPFNPPSAPQLLEMQRRGVRVNPIELRSNLPTEAQAIILSGLSFHPASRYQSASQFGNTLARALSNEETSAPHPNSPGRVTTMALHPESLNTRRLNLSRRQFAAIATSLVVMIAGTLLLLYHDSSEDGEIIDLPSTSPTRSFIFSLTVQRMRNNESYGDAFQSTGQDIFDNGDKFRLNFFSSVSGYVYVFAERPPREDRSSFMILYPIPTTNNGSATLGADQWVHTNWNTFVDQAATENVWMIWSTAPVEQLEAAKIEAFKRPNRALSGKSLDQVKAFLLRTQEQVKTRISRDKSSQQTTVRGVGDVLVRLLPLQHR